MVIDWKKIYTVKETAIHKVYIKNLAESSLWFGTFKKEKKKAT